MDNRDLLVGAGIGAALAFLLDPAAGGRRRALLRDKAVRATRKTREGLQGHSRDLANRARGLSAEVRGRRADEPVDDRRVLERVRAQLGRVSTHPRAIDVESSNGDVTLRGPILASEVEPLLGAVAAVRGVRSVVNHLEPHAFDDGVPSLQGKGRAARSFVIPVSRSWIPSIKGTVLGAASLAAGAYFVSQAGRRA